MKPIACAFVPSEGHAFADHPEGPHRFANLKPRLEQIFGSALHWVRAAPASLRLLERIHTPQMLAALEEDCRRAPALVDLAPTYVTPASWDSALLAAGATLECTRAVLQGTASAAFAIVRPPGHHAESDSPMGFCLLNNAALAVSEALQHGLERIMLVDFDAHHGNGTEEIFWNDERVFFFSSHQAEIYPGSGALDSAPHARGRILNAPLPPYSGDAAYAQLFDAVVLPWARKVQPQIIFACIGYDAHWQDPLTTLGLSVCGYHHLCRVLMELAAESCQGRLVAILEGGYEPQILFQALSASLAAMLSLPAPADPAGASPNREPDIQPLIRRLLTYHNLE